MKQWLQGSRHLIIKDSDPYEKENKPGYTYHCLNLLPWGFPGHTQGVETEVEPNKLLELRRQSWKTEKINTARVFSTQYHKGQSFTEICRRSPLSIQLRLICACTWEIYPMQEKSSPKMIRANSAWHHPLVKNSASSPQSYWGKRKKKKEKSLEFTLPCVEYTEESCFSSGRKLEYCII